MIEQSNNLSLLGETLERLAPEGPPMIATSPSVTTLDKATILQVYEGIPVGAARWGRHYREEFDDLP